MRLQQVDPAQIPADLGAWYRDVYQRVGVGNYQGLAYHVAHEFDRLNVTLDALRGLPEHGSCLEVGCANGIITKELANIFGGVLAVDINPAALAVCPRLDNVEYIKADIEADAITGTFDVILLSDVLEHLRDPKAVIAKCAAHARYVVAVGPTTEPLNAQNAFNADLLGHGSQPGDGTGHIWYMDLEGMLSLFEGLNIVRVASAGAHHSLIVARGKA